ncbi:Na(+)/citrate cotransporter-like [Glandiceps talaboti]
MVSCKGVLRPLWNNRKLLILVLTPTLLCPLLVVIGNQAASCAYAVLIIAIYWMTDVLPMAVTALLPVLLFPLLGVMHSSQVCANYMKDIIMTMIGAFFVADAMEHWNIHRRFALRILLHTASSHRWLMFGLMCVTSFLAMWMSNSVVTAMMVPLVIAILKEIDDKRKETSSTSTTVEGELLKKESEEIELNIDSPKESVAETITSEESDDDISDKSYQRLCKGLVLCIAYSANIGGTATLYGTSSNIVMTGQLESMYGYDATIDFGTWFAYGFPNQLIILLVAWLVLQWRFLDLKWISNCFKCQFSCRRQYNTPSAAESIIRQQHAELGSMSWAEGVVLGHFVVLSVLWLTYDPRFIPGWASLFDHRYVTSTTATMAVVVSLSLIPARRPNFLRLGYWRCEKKANISEAKDKEKSSNSNTLLDWRRASSNMRWEVIFLMGAGYAIADAFEVSGLSDYLGEQFKVFASIPAWSLVAVCTVLIAVLTEFISNTATAAVFLPIIAKMAESTSINPHYLIIPTTVASSFAFMLPIATPPNAIAFSYGMLTVLDMIKSGILMNIASLVIVNLTINSLGVILFDLHSYPSWANAVTAAPSTLPLCVDFNDTLSTNIPS